MALTAFALGLALWENPVNATIETRFALAAALGAGIRGDSASPPRASGGGAPDRGSRYRVRGLRRGDSS